MKRLKYLLLLAGFGFSVSLKAQEHPKQPVDTVRQRQNILTGSANARYFVLDKATPVYLQPADTLSSLVARRLQGGRKVYIRKFLPTGYLVELPTHNEQYYLPAKLVSGLRVYVEI
jgi:hypothetical protein